MATPKTFQLAVEIFAHLVACAKDRRTITYGQLEKLVGHPAYFLGKPLDVLRDQILLEHHLPRLDALVVNKDTREVGDNFFADGRGSISNADFKRLLDGEREKVFAYERWDEINLRLRAMYLKK